MPPKKALPARFAAFVVSTMGVADVRGHVGVVAAEAAPFSDQSDGVREGVAVCVRDGVWLGVPVCVAVLLGVLDGVPLPDGVVDADAVLETDAVCDAGVEVADAVTLLLAVLEAVCVPDAERVGVCVWDGYVSVYDRSSSTKRP